MPSPSQSPEKPSAQLRRSPRKKAWGSPTKTPTRNALANSLLFNESDFSPLSNASWAEQMESDTESTSQLLSTGDAEETQRKRKATEPKRVTTKPKFVRSLELEKGISSGSRQRRGREEVRAESTAQGSRKRHLSSSSTVVNEGEDCASPRKRTAPSSSGRPARKAGRAEGTPSPARNRLFLNRATPASPSLRPKDHYDEPTLGWCTDEATIEKRNKEIEKAKQKPVYAQYLKEVPLADRVKGVHPKTPNKLINFSRRSWDSQVKSWKRSLYDWAGEEPSDSVNTSFYSETSEEASQANDSADTKKPILSALSCEDIHDTGLTTLLGKFDTGADESTLKAESRTVDGPIDFSAGLHS